MNINFDIVVVSVYFNEVFFIKVVKLVKEVVKFNDVDVDVDICR